MIPGCSAGCGRAGRVDPAPQRSDSLWVPTRGLLMPPSVVMVLTALLAAPPAAPAQPPADYDDRLDLSLFATDPDVVTPVGLACDEHARVFALESHTHSPPRDYPGPKTDRIKVFSDENRDGKADAVKVFADGIQDGMNLAFSPQ